MEDEILRESIFEVTRRLWHGSLDSNVAFVRTLPPDVLSGASRAARVEISGAWRGSVVIQATEELARGLAEIMFDLKSHGGTQLHGSPTQMPIEELIEDCIREVTNITAGNLKTALPEPCELSIPTLCSFQEWDRFTEFGERLYQLAFRCESMPTDRAFFRITLCRAAATTVEGMPK